MSNEIDALMDLDPLSLTKDNIDSVIAYHRQRRAERESGGGKRAKRDTGPKLALGDLVKGMVADKPAAAGPIVKRRI